MHKWSAYQISRDGRTETPCADICMLHMHHANRFYIYIKAYRVSTGRAQSVVFVADQISRDGKGNNGLKSVGLVCRQYI
jgi:hypothetical protein